MRSTMRSPDWYKLRGVEMARKPKLGLPLQTLRNAPDALEGRKAREAAEKSSLRDGIAEIDTDLIDVDGRLVDRLQLGVEDLKASIQQSGQRVPILLRPLENGRFRLIYGRRRLEACRELGIKIRAIVTELDDSQALQDQILENQDRRDLSFIERALVASALLDGSHLGDDMRSNKGVAEIMNLTEAGVSQLLSVVRIVGEDLILAIGAAPGIGRPRWEDLKKAIGSGGVDRNALIDAANLSRGATKGDTDPSDTAFLAVLQSAQPMPPVNKAPKTPVEPLVIHGVGEAQVKQSGRGKKLRIELQSDDKDFVSWLESQTPEILSELHNRWKQQQNN